MAEAHPLGRERVGPADWYDCRRAAVAAVSATRWWRRWTCFRPCAACAVSTHRGRSAAAIRRTSGSAAARRGGTADAVHVLHRRCAADRNDRFGVEGRAHQALELLALPRWEHGAVRSSVPTRCSCEISVASEDHHPAVAQRAATLERFHERVGRRHEAGHRVSELVRRGGA